MFGLKCKILKIFILQIIFVESYGALFKMTKLECRDVNENLVRINSCRLKVVKRGVIEATIRYQFLQPFNNWNAHIELLRKYNSYQPIINKTFDICAFFKNRKEALYLNILYKLIEDYTNVNHTCPYEGEFIVDHFRPLYNNFILPIPSGDYLLKIGFYNKKSLTVSLLVWFRFTELEKWEIHKKE